MTAHSLLYQSLESIAHQRDTAFFQSLIESVKVLRSYGEQLQDSGKRADAITESGIEPTINQYTGLSVDIRLDPNLGINMAVMPPLVDSNHVLLNSIQQQVTGDDPKDLQRLKKLKKQLTGSIDLEKGHVYGIYTQITSPIVIGTQLLLAKNRDGSSLFDDDEIAAVVAHEIGHLMTYYEYIGRTALMTHVLGQASKQLTNTTSSKKKVEIAQVTGEILDLDNFEPQAFGEVDDASVFQSIVISEYVTKKTSATNTSFYDRVTWEALADQYVSRLGGARPLTTVSDKIQRISGNTAKNRFHREMTLATQILVSAVITIAWPFSRLAAFLAGFIVTGLTVYNLTPDEYDAPKDRLQRIRNDMVDRMKDPNTTQDDRKWIQKEIEKIDVTIDNVVEFHAPYRALLRFVIPSVRRQMRYKKLIQQLEQLVNNELFVKSNQLQVTADQ